MRRYITTAIDYPNAAPHMGHVLEKVLADVIARWFRLRGDDVRFQIGTDEHGTKIQQTAEKEGMTPKELVDRNVPLFQDLYTRLNISHDHFIRTSDQKEHWPTVTELWKRLEAAGMLEKRSYTGLYCSGCERFMTKRDLDENGMCPHHKKKPEEVTEENWFFLMSKDTTNLKNLLTKEWDGASYRIIPEHRANETLSLIEQGLEDVSFSRPKSSLSWGVPVPGDDEQVMYVWCDALTNYISGIGLLTDHAQPEWWDDAKVTHVIGKDIARFHALIWPDMLKHAEVRTPDELLIHGFLTSEGEKMSKSLGNVVVPQDVINKYGVDALRMYLSSEIPVGNDGDYSERRMNEIYDSHLRNELGNLLNRVLVMIKKEGGNVDYESDLELQGGERRFSRLGSMKAEDGGVERWLEYEKHMNAFEFQKALKVVWDLVGGKTMIGDQEHQFHGGNGFMQTWKPWEEKNPIVKQQKLQFVAEYLRHVSLMLIPFMPQKAYEIAKQLNVPYAEEMRPDNKEFVITAEMKKWGYKDWKAIGEPSILFTPLT